MELNSNYLSKLIRNDKTLQPQTNNTPQGVNNTVQQNNLPSTHAAGLSQVTTNAPVSYTKIAEIPIPGISEKASVFKLSNGQKVAILKQKGPTQIQTAYAVGSLNEPDELRGISHYIEHTLFQGSKDLAPKEYHKKVALLGGNSNAATSINRTNYYITLQQLEDKSLEEAIKLNALQTQYPTFPNEQLKKEKEPVKQEIDKCKDDPTNIAYKTMICNLFGLKTTSEDIIAGTKDNINNLTRDKVLNYYNTWYTPDNAVTVITGDVDVNETMKLVSKYYNKKPDTSKHNQRIYPNLVPTNKPIRVDQTQNVNPLAFVIMGLPVDGNITQTEKEQLNVLFSLIASNNSPISKALDEYRQSLHLSLSNVSSDTKAPKMIYTELSMPEEQVEDILKIIYEGINHYVNNPPNEEELQKCINSELESLEAISESSKQLNTVLIELLQESDYNSLENKKNILKTTKPQDIQNVAKKFLDLNKVSLYVAHPSSTTPEQMIENHKNAKTNEKTISFGRAIDVKTDVHNDLNQASNLRLQNAMELSILPSIKGNKASFSMKLKTDLNENVYQCVTYILSEMINRGSLYRQNADFKNILEENNIGLGFAVGTNSINIGASFKPEKADMTMALLKETLMYPNFTEEEFQRAKTIVKEIYENSTKSPQDKIKQHLNPNSKYFVSNEEELQVLENLTLNDVKQLYTHILYNSQALTTCAVNQNSMPIVQNSLINNLSVGLPQFRQFIPAKESYVQKYQPNTQPYLYTDTKDQAQAEIVQSYQFKHTGNIEDTAKIKLLNMILGFDGSSRLFTDLRETQDLAYCVDSTYTTEFDRGEINLNITTSTESDEATPDNINKSLEGFDRNVHRLKTEYVSQEELDSVKAQYKTIILNDLEMNHTRNSILENCKNSPYGMEHYTKLLEAIDKVTIEDIMATANYVFANPPITSIIANPKTLETLNLK